LTFTHLVIEVIAISTHRNFAQEHPIWQLLTPHYINTMSLNYFARSTLVPDVIAEISPLSLTGALNLATSLFDDWKFEEAGAEDDLKARGFNPATLDTDFPGNSSYSITSCPCPIGGRLDDEQTQTTSFDV
jgi:hypothetical protein